MSEDDLRKDIDYALKIGQSYLGFLERLGVRVKGAKVLELGPGKNYGAVMVLSCLGAKCAVVDKYLSGWEPSEHPNFYKALQDAIRFYYPQANLSPLKQLLRSGSYCEGVLKRIASPCESLSSLETDYFDVVLSNAVLEHLVDPPQALEEMFRVTKPGGWSVHQIDFRDHRDFTMPLEYLFLTDNEFASTFVSANGECGNRFRASQFAGFFRQAGFLIDAVENNMFSEPGYFSRTRQRLNDLQMNFSDDDLKVLSGRIYARRPVSSDVIESAVCRSGVGPDRLDNRPRATPRLTDVFGQLPLPAVLKHRCDNEAVRHACRTEEKPQV